MSGHSVARERSRLMSIVTGVEQLLAILVDRETNIRNVPTIAAPHNIQNALESLPKALPEKGLGTEGPLLLFNMPYSPGSLRAMLVLGAIPAALHGDILASVYDQNVQVNLPAETISTTVEHRTLELLLDLLKLPRESFPGRTITTGATASNVLGLACGRDFAIRHAIQDPEYSAAEHGLSRADVKVLADRPHASLLKAASLVGIGRSNVIDMFDAKAQQIDLTLLEGRLAACPPGGLQGIIVALSFGEVNTGESSPNVKKIRELCDRYHAWLHIDAAFGAFARLVPELQDQAAGLELADSITSDAHKWLNVPYDSGLFFCRSLELQTSIFGPSPRSAPPPYLTPIGPLGSQVSPEMESALLIPSPLNIGIENSRRFRALPIFCALLSLGRDGYTEMIRRHVEFARRLGRWMTSGEGSKWFEVLNLSPGVSSISHSEPVVPLNIVLFRARPGPLCPAIFSHTSSDGLGSSRLVRAINDTRRLYVSPSMNAVRIAVSNWMTGLPPAHSNSADKDDFDIVTAALIDVMTSAASSSATICA
ncbi:hypothetical protein BS47DRAFT_1389988 [Hydnum rufescens UP504]|uniref:Uncharacterized protein n=1 Tax=Hydnum rufescens UP504 TaxID=1448309 RepID=A0A9P6B487_9AGAM|nr:hypothetical protein BS47DRAFT_1389988 [Hydnum rufescens UP504]